MVDFGSLLNSACKIHHVLHYNFVILKAGGTSPVKWMERAGVSSEMYNLVMKSGE